MNRKTLHALVALNLVLAVGLALAVLTPRDAKAQFGPDSQYLMISGDVQQRRQQAAVYILELNTGNMVSVLFNGSSDELEFIATRNIANDAFAGRGR